ncbi:unnamed protein product [Larinioides sclopetarius]|uniref:Secreted protein n=1 Tax=Larinioides sclopetarius TaxID=280406 RepID=A0AAV1Z7A7_9ARAC
MSLFWLEGWPCFFCFPWPTLFFGAGDATMPSTRTFRRVTSPGKERPGVRKHPSIAQISRDPLTSCCRASLLPSKVLQALEQQKQFLSPPVNRLKFLCGRDLRYWNQGPPSLGV